MHSPLPDASALEAGIIEDDRPTRGSRVQDNVRNLLRASVFSSIRGSAIGTAWQQPSVEDEPRSPAQSPLQRRFHMQPEVLPSPSSATTTSTTTTTSSDEEDAVSGVLFPPVAYQQQVQEMAHQSTMFNTRAVMALHHPDLSDPSMALFLQQKTESRQRRAWKRSRNQKLRRASGRRKASSWMLCLLAGLLLVGIVATYLALATSSDKLSTTFHVLFILGILLATIVFAHTLVRLLFFRTAVPDSPRLCVVSSNGRLKRRHRHRRHDHQSPQSHQRREMTTMTDGTADYIPRTPIPVHVVADEVRPDSREAQPTAGAERASAVWENKVDDLPNPPPAYGRWRGSVRANPDLLHWEAVPSPVDPETPALPSPTYEEAMAAVLQATGPPSYVTRDSPERRRDIHDARPELAQAQAAERGLAPEMVEAREAGEATTGLGYHAVSTQ